MEIRIRGAIPSDINFIYATWLRSYRYGSTTGRSVQNTIFFPEYNKVIDNLLSKSTVLVACLDTDNEVIFGYLVYEANTIHYCFIKESFRGLGIMNKLITSLIFKYHTHETYLGEGLIKKYHLIYNPFLLYQRGLNG